MNAHAQTIMVDRDRSHDIVDAVNAAGVLVLDGGTDTPVPKIRAVVCPVCRRQTTVGRGTRAICDGLTCNEVRNTRH